MRYNGLPNITFTNAKKETRILKNERIANRSSSFVMHTKLFQEELDGVATKFWGNNMEVFSYMIREQNVEQLLLRDFDERQINSLMIPPEDYDD